MTGRSPSRTGQLSTTWQVRTLHWGILGALHCLKEQFYPPCTNSLLRGSLPWDVPWNCSLFHWRGELALLHFVQHKRVFVTPAGKRRVGYNLGSIGFPGTGPSKAAVQNLFGTEVTCPHPADDESVMQYLSNLDYIFLQCSLFTIFYPKMFGVFVVFFFYKYFRPACSADQF